MPDLKESQVVRTGKALTADKAVELVSKWGAYAIHLGSKTTRVFAAKVGIYEGIDNPYAVMQALDAAKFSFYYGDVVSGGRGVLQYAAMMAGPEFDKIVMSGTNPLLRIWYVDKAMNPTIRTIRATGWSMQYAGCIEGECTLRGEVRTFSRQRIVRYEVL